MSTPFTHLHVASGYSLRYGTSPPQTLVEAAAAQGMPALALTDRDGLYGAVKFALACEEAGITPILGVDLAVEPGGLPAGSHAGADPTPRPGPGRRTPARGGAEVDLRHPRATVLALGQDARAGLPPATGWARLCRLVSATHLRGERGTPVSSPELIAEHATVPGAPVPALAVLLGPDSEVGRAILARRPDLAREILRRWSSLLPAGALFVEVVCHHGAPHRPGSLSHATRMLAVARQSGVPAVLTNAVRYTTPGGAATADVLDAARRLVPLDARHIDRVSSEGYLADGNRMADVAREVAEAAAEPAAAAELLATTAALAARCHLDLGRDLGVGSVRFPENHLLGLPPDEEMDAVLRRRCEARIGTTYPGASAEHLRVVRDRLHDELVAITALGYASYFLTVADVCDLIRDLGVRVAARGSGAGSLVNYLLGISGVDPIRHGLLMERFMSPLRAELPDIDLDVESHRRTEVYEAVLARFGAERVAAVSMMDTYRVRHAVRDVGAALGLPPGEIDTIAKAFPHVRARDARRALAELPELRASGLGSGRLDLLFDLVERLDGLPRHIALHPCGLILSDATLLDRTPVEASWTGLPMSQFDKDDVEAYGLVKLDILGIRMQSAMAYALDEIARVDGADASRAGNHPDGATDPDTGYLDPVSGRIDLDAVPHDDEATFRLIRSTHTLGVFQVESPGQRELIGKFAPRTFGDLIIDISLFRPGPVKSDMINPFLRARQGWERPHYLHPRLEFTLRETHGVVVFHEQVLRLVAVTTGCDLAEADEARRALGSPEGQAEVEVWWRSRARAEGYDEASIERIWRVLKSFASFGFCKAHAAASALPTYHSAWLKTHHPAAFLAGVLTHDPGMYPKRLILDDARNLGITVLPLDVNASVAEYRVERLTPPPAPALPDAAPPDAALPEAAPADAAPPDATPPEAAPADAALPDGSDYGIRIGLSEVKGISEAEVARVIAGRPYQSLADFWHRARLSRPVVERLVVAGAFDSLYGLGLCLPVSRRDRVTRRDLLLQIAELNRWTRSVEQVPRRPRRPRITPASGRGDAETSHGGFREGALLDVRSAAARQSRASFPSVPPPERSVQLVLELGDAPDETRPNGLPEMTGAERVRAELEVLGLDVSRHVLDFYAPMLQALRVARSRDLLGRRGREELLVAGVKVATQTPPIRSGRRVVFLTLDDSTGPIDATFFEDAQGPYAATVFHSWLLLVRGVLRRTGPRGVSLRATGAWELPLLWDTWTEAGPDAVYDLLTVPGGGRHVLPGGTPGAPAPVPARPPVSNFGGPVLEEPDWEATTGLPSGDRSTGGPSGGRSGSRSSRAGGMGGGPRYRKVLVHPSGFQRSPYPDVRPPGENTRNTRRTASAGGSSPAGRPPVLGPSPVDEPPLVPPAGLPVDEPPLVPPVVSPLVPPPAGAGDPARRRRTEAPRKLWHASPGSSGH